MEARVKSLQGEIARLQKEIAEMQKEKSAVESFLLASAYNMMNMMEDMHVPMEDTSILSTCCSCAELDYSLFKQKTRSQDQFEQYLKEIISQIHLNETRIRTLEESLRGSHQYFPK